MGVNRNNWRLRLLFVTNVLGLLFLNFVADHRNSQFVLLNIILICLTLQKDARCD